MSAIHKSHIKQRNYFAYLANVGSNKVTRNTLASFLTEEQLNNGFGTNVLQSETGCHPYYLAFPWKRDSCIFLRTATFFNGPQVTLNITISYGDMQTDMYINSINISDFIKYPTGDYHRTITELVYADLINETSTKGITKSFNKVEVFNYISNRIYSNVPGIFIDPATLYISKVNNE